MVQNYRSQRVDSIIRLPVPPIAAAFTVWFVAGELLRVSGVVSPRLPTSLRNLSLSEEVEVSFSGRSCWRRAQPRSNRRKGIDSTHNLRIA